MAMPLLYCGGVWSLSRAGKQVDNAADKAKHETKEALDYLAVDDSRGGP